MFAGSMDSMGRVMELAMPIHVHHSLASLPRHSVVSDRPVIGVPIWHFSTPLPQHDYAAVAVIVVIACFVSAFLKMLRALGLACRISLIVWWCSAGWCLV